MSVLITEKFINMTAILLMSQELRLMAGENYMKIEDINPWWITAKVQEEYSNFEKRDLFNEIAKYIPDRQIIVISGLRRTGKTVTLHHLIDFLLKSNKKENILYFSFDLFDEKIDSLLEIYSEKVKIALKKENGARL